MFLIMVNFMISVPAKQMSGFQDFMSQKAIQKNFWPHYKKWFRYYWDFCHKYHHPVMASDSLNAFLEKLLEKKQNDFQVKQASQAVLLYYDFLDKPALSEPSLTEAYLPPASSNKNLHCLKEKSSPDHQAKNAGEQNTNSETKDTNSSPKISLKAKKHKQNYDTHLRGSCRKKSLNKEQTGADWTIVFDDFCNEIKDRHYSPRTLKNYSMWLRKFQTFTKSKTVELITVEDYKAFLTYLAVKKTLLLQLRIRPLMPCCFSFAMY
jgi:hypothetical protein